MFECIIDEAIRSISDGGGRMEGRQEMRLVGRRGSRLSGAL